MTRPVFLYYCRDCDRPIEALGKPERCPHRGSVFVGYTPLRRK